MWLSPADCKENIEALWNVVTSHNEDKVLRMRTLEIKNFAYRYA